MILHCYHHRRQASVTSAWSFPQIVGHGILLVSPSHIFAREWWGIAMRTCSTCWSTTRTRNKVICYNFTPAQNLTCDVWRETCQRVNVSTNERALRRWYCCTCSKWHQGFGCNKKSFDLWAQGKCLSRKNKPIRDKHIFNEQRHKTRFRGIKKIGNFCKTINILDKNKTIDSTHNLKPKKA